MSEERKEITDGEREAFGSIAGDAMTVFRAGLFVIVIYISILSLVFNSGGVPYVENIANSWYTINGMVFWAGSLSFSILTHRMARRITLQKGYSQLGRLDDRWQVLNSITACTFGLLIAVFSLIFGLLEGWVNTINDTSVHTPLHQPIGVILLSTLFVFGLYGVVSLLDWIRQRWGPIRKILRIS